MAKTLTPYQRHMKRALKGKMKGKTKAQRKAIFRAAAKSWKKKSGVRKTSTKSRVSTRIISRRRTYAKNPSGGRNMGKKGFLNEQTIFSLVRKGALVAPALGRVFEGRPPMDTVKHIIYDYTGYSMYDGSFHWSRLIRGWGPYVLTKLVTMGVQKISSMLRRL